jgi:hypothetical protein
MCDKQIPWQDVSYLLDGNERQREAYRALQSLGVFGVLRDYTPVLVGTIPIAVDVEESDLDIVCEVHDLIAFEGYVIRAFSQCEGFQVRQKLVKGVPSVVVSFFHSGFRIEIFGQPQLVMEQHAYRHMVVEARLLAIGGEDARQRIQRFKSAGLKTEPAFARHFNLAGDPYAVLLQLSGLSEDELRAQVRA